MLSIKLQLYVGLKRFWKSRLWKSQHSLTGSSLLNEVCSCGSDFKVSGVKLRDDVFCAGHMSTAQAMALATAHNYLGWSRTRFWPKLFRLSDLALYSLAELDAMLVGKRKLPTCLHDKLHPCIMLTSFFPICVAKERLEVVCC